MLGWAGASGAPPSVLKGWMLMILALGARTRIGNRVIAKTSPWMTARQSPQGQPTPAPWTVSMDRLLRVDGTSGLESTTAARGHHVQHRREGVTINKQQSKQNPSYKTRHKATRHPQHPLHDASPSRRLSAPRKRLSTSAYPASRIDRRATSRTSQAAGSRS